MLTPNHVWTIINILNIDPIPFHQKALSQSLLIAGCKGVNYGCNNILAASVHHVRKSRGGGGSHESRRSISQTETERPFNAKFVRAEVEEGAREWDGGRRDGKVARTTLTAAPPQIHTSPERDPGCILVSNKNANRTCNSNELPENAKILILYIYGSILLCT